MKVLFLVPYPTSGPSTRYRVEQYLSYLKKNGVDCKISPFVSEQFYKIIYKPGKYFNKLFYLSKGLIRRFIDIFEAIESDVIFVHLEAFPFGPPILEWLFSFIKKPFIFDLDDVVYTKHRVFVNMVIKALKYPRKIPAIIELSSHVITCNLFLKEYASQFKDPEKIDVIHTSIDTSKFSLRNYKNKNNSLIIGWIGTHTTARYLNLLTRVFQQLTKKYNFVLKVVGAGRQIKFDGVKILNEEWSLQRDVENFQSLDIGVYPLVDDEWSKGKTGFKTIQYMSVGVPCVVSNVGANRYIIQDGINGFLADTEEEWVTKLSLLIENDELRHRMGVSGRKTVEEKFSVDVSAPRFLNIIRKVYEEGI